MLTQEQYENLKEGDAVSYHAFSKVYFVRRTLTKADGTPYKEPHVIMRDSLDNEKTVFESLFVKYAKVIK